MKPLWLALILGALAVSVPAGAQAPSVAAKVEALGKINSANSPSLSPDGRFMAYLSNETGSPQVWIRDLTGATPPRQLTRLPDPSVMCNGRRPANGWPMSSRPAVG